MNENQHRSQSKPNTNTKSNKKPSTKIAKPVTKIVYHPLLGDVPMLEKTFVAPNGKTYPYTVFDPDFKPKMPVGAMWMKQSPAFNVEMNLSFGQKNNSIGLKF